jgi:hypothetical protein
MAERHNRTFICDCKIPKAIARLIVMFREIESYLTLAQVKLTRNECSRTFTY